MRRRYGNCNAYGKTMSETGCTPVGIQLCLRSQTGLWEYKLLRTNNEKALFSFRCGVYKYCCSVYTTGRCRQRVTPPIDRQCMTRCFCMLDRKSAADHIHTEYNALRHYFFVGCLICLVNAIQMGQATEATNKQAYGKSLEK